MKINSGSENRKVALVTGGSRGIGRAIAVSLAAEGYDLAITHVKNKPEKSLDLCRQKGVHAISIKADIGDAASRKHIIDSLKSQFGRLNVVVNNAGIAPAVRADVLEASEKSYDMVMNTNLKGPYFFTQLAARWMIEQKKDLDNFTACIINISSISAVAASFMRGEYCISKAGISMVTKLWASRLGEYGIDVYEVRPGIIRTDMTKGVEEKYDRQIAGGLLIQPRWGLPEDVGKAVASLVRGDLTYSSGQVICVDGGMSVQRL